MASGAASTLDQLPVDDNMNELDATFSDEGLLPLSESPGLLGTTQKNEQFNTSAHSNTGLLNVPTLEPLPLSADAISDNRLTEATDAINPQTISTSNGPEEDVLTGIADGNLLADTTNEIGDIFVVSGDVGETVTLRFQWTYRDAKLNNEMGVFAIDANGKVNDLAPGEVGFAQAALNSGSRQILFSHGQQTGAWKELNFQAGDRLAFYLVQDSSTADWLARNPKNQADQGPIAFFSLDGVNPDGVDHVRSQSFGEGIQSFAWEDLWGGGDRDFNDAVLLVSEAGIGIPGDIGQSATLTVDLLSHSARFRNEMGFFLVDDARGRIGTLKPGSQGYAAAALSQANRQVVFAKGQDAGAVSQYQIPAGKFLGWYLIQDATTTEFLAQNPNNQLDKGPVAFFSYPGANPDGLSHVHFQAANEMVWEDMTGVGDRDYNDLIFSYELKAPQVAGEIILAEGDNFEVSHRQSITISDQPSTLQFTLADLAFDTTDNDAINDAFEAALVDSEGNSLVHTITDSRDAFFNWTEGETPQLANGVSHDGQTITVSLAGIAAGTEATLLLRLVNNDDDTTTQARIRNIQTLAADVLPSTENNLTSTQQPTADLTESLIFDGIQDVSTSLTVDYGLTSFNEETETLFTDFTVSNTGQYEVDKPLIMAVANISDPTVTVLGADGLTLNGLPYYDLSAEINGIALAPGEETDNATLRFKNPNEIQFTYDLVFLGSIDDSPPEITAQLEEDTGSDDTDGLTSNPTITGQVVSERPITVLEGSLDDTNFIDISDALNGEDNSFTLSLEQYERLTGGSMPDGDYTVTLRATNDVNLTSNQAVVTFTFDRTPPPISFELAPESDTGIVGDGTTTERLVTLVGQTEPGLSITFDNAQQTVVADEEGSFTITNAAMSAAGAVPFSVRTVDAAGNQGWTQEMLTREGINGAPEITSTPETTFDAGQQVTYSYQLEATDPDGDELTYSLIEGPLEADIDETGLLTFTPSGILRPDYVFTVEVTDDRGGKDTQSFTVVDPVISAVTGEIRGIKWNDLNANGFRDTELVQGRDPDVVFVIDVSGSADFAFDGSPLGDVNGDGLADTRLDAEIAGFITLNEQLTSLGLGEQVDISIVVFSGFAANADMNLIEEGLQLTTTSNADIDGNGISDIEDILKSIRSGAFGVGNATGTNPEAALQQVETTFDTIGTQDGDGNVIFLTDGDQNRGGTILDEVDRLLAKDVNLTAFGVGNDAALGIIQAIDPDGSNFESTDELLDAFAGLIGGPDNSLEPGLPGVSVYLDANDNGILDPNEPIQITAENDPSTPDIDESGQYAFTNLLPGNYVVREVVPEGFVQTFPVSINAATGDGYADTVLAYFDSVGVGPLGGIAPDFNTPVQAESPVSTDVVLGNDEDQVDFLRLPQGSSITVGFTDEVIIDGPGDDIFIAEFIPRDEQANVFVSSNLTDFTLLGVADGGTTTALDLNDIEFTEPVRAVKIVALNNGTGSPGFELANVQGLPNSIISPDFHYVTLETGEVVENIDFGNFSGGIIRGTKWEDANGNGLRDAGELGIGGVSIYLDENNNGLLDSGDHVQITAGDNPNTQDVDETGQYTFTDLLPGTYIVREVIPDGFVQTAPIHSIENPTGVTEGGSLQLIQPDPNVAATFVGKAGLSTDALGTNSPGSLQALIPEGGTIEHAFLHVATTTSPSNAPSEVISDTPFRPTTIDFDGISVALTWLDNVEDSNHPSGRLLDFETGRADVTSLVANKAGNEGGIFNFSIDETVIGNPTFISGTSLSVIYTHPDLPEQTIVLLEGGLTNSSTNILTFDSPLNVNEDNFNVEMALGIQGGYLAGGQYSLIDINGERLTSSAGDKDDGVKAEGALITLGGIGDSNANPTNPLATRDFGDDELYDITSFIEDGDTSLQLDTVNLSQDDSLFLAAFTISQSVNLKRRDFYEVDLGAGEVIENIDFGNNRATSNEANSYIISQPSTTATTGVPYRYEVIARNTDGDALTYILSNAPDGMTIDKNGIITWENTAVGRYLIEIQVIDENSVIITQSFELEIIEAVVDTEAPQVDLGFTGTVFNVGDTLDLQIRGFDNVGLADLDLSIDSNALALDPDIATNGLINSTSVTLDQSGLFDVVATATDTSGNIDTKTLAIRVIDPTDDEAPFVAFNEEALEALRPKRLITPDGNFVPVETVPPDSDLPVLLLDPVIDEVTDLIGTVRDENLVSYRVEYAPASLVNLSQPAANDPDYILLAEGDSNLEDGVFATIDPRLIANDDYFFRVVAKDVGGNINTQGVVLAVFSENKPGEFTQTFTDLSIPLAGIPITVSRTYSSFNTQHSDDFGYGWNLDIQDAQIRESVPDTGGFFSATPFKVGSRVTLTSPEGKRIGFTFDPQPNPVSFLGANFRPHFTPDPGVEETLEVVDNIPLTIRSDATVGLFPINFNYNPSEYILTTKDGTKYRYDEDAGLQTITDRNGNVLTYTEDGITSSTGQSIQFERDDQGRIEQIIDPEGNVIEYTYDNKGDLIAVEDRTEHETEFIYDDPDRAHYLTGIINPLGDATIRTEYDDQGQIERIIDAEGNALDLNFDSAASTQTVTDPFGNPITFVFDDRGNVVREIDARGGEIIRTYYDDNNLESETDQEGYTTTYTYDDRGNRLTETNGEEKTTTFTYYADNRIKTETDPLGNTTTFKYDDKGNLTEREDAEGHITIYDYDDFGLLRKLIDPLKNETTFDYDRYGNLERIVDPTEGVSTFTYDANGNLKTFRNPLGYTYTYDVDDEGRVKSVTDPEGGVETTIYNGLGDRMTTIDALGRETEYRYNNRGLLVETIYPDSTPEDLSDNPSVINDYDALDRLISTTDEAGRTTYFIYDELGRVVQTIYPDETPDTLDDNPRTRTEYFDNGLVKAEIDELGNRTEFDYDKASRLIEQKDALGHIITFTYDDAGNQETITDALGRITLFDYDNLGQLEETQFADGSKETLTYNALGYLETETDQAGNITTFDYDPFGRLIEVEDALGHITVYKRDLLGNIFEQIDANEHKTIFNYDKVGQRKGMTLPLGQTSTTEYDLAGNIFRTIDFNGDVITYEYDERNRLVAKRLPDEVDELYTYTPTGQLETVTDGRGVTLYFYDERDRLISRTEPDGRVISYTYDDAGNVTSLTTPSGTIVYTYDSLNRLETVTDPDEGVTTYIYDAVSNLKQTVFLNSVIETREYDPLNRLEFLENRNNDEVLSSYRYTLDPVGNRTKVEEHSGRVVDYDYDELYRLKKETITDPEHGNRSTEYVFDDVGNRLEKKDSVEGTTTYTYDDNDRLRTETLNGLVTEYRYDDNGNLITTLKNEENIATYQWNAEGELIAVDINENGETGRIEYQYDHEGLRVVMTVNGEETRFLLDKTQQEYAQVIEEYRASGENLASYVHGLDLISQEQGNDQFFYQVDGLGSTRILTDVNGLLTDQYLYDAYGQALNQTGDTSNNYLFAGEQLDPELAEYYLRARYYDPATGSFDSRDPFEGFDDQPITLQDYLYTGNNPVNFIDPTGHASLPPYSLKVKVVSGGILGSVLNLKKLVICTYISGGKISGRDILVSQVNGFIAGYLIALTLSLFITPTVSLGISGVRNQTIDFCQSLPGVVS
ncbi:DUF4114 domain-containing protein [Leptothoe spongobia]|uniref:DUF4114 domain-containing protein n=1 Tax=Leptothoe spongobia TAU-MAC 1115 TaxID=1967444 RepID=A0A947GPA2_9CYAN|nr:DUF4114 domain-containing protein [Leptothoe spongobia]MBT9316451.1 DUF4114 domain-containing protein [Leptothoe spongobia TAU-MAC 1115]